MPNDSESSPAHSLKATSALDTAKLRQAAAPYTKPA